MPYCETADGDFHQFKVDILAGLITYSSDKNLASNLETISIERAKAIIEMNRQGEKPLSLLEDGKAKPVAKPTDLLAEGDLSRFDKAKKKKKKKNNKNKGPRRLRETTSRRRTRTARRMATTNLRRMKASQTTSATTTVIRAIILRVTTASQETTDDLTRETSHRVETSRKVTTPLRMATPHKAITPHKNKE